jgi:ParB family transcriptional regulator, chromosome partitioning protein
MATAKLDLSALDLDDAPVAAPAAAVPENQVAVVLELELNKCFSKPQVRTIFDEAELNKLAESFKKHGQLEPIKVASADLSGLHLILQGERRWRAARIAGLTKVRAIIEDEPRAMSSYAQVAENKDRDNLKAIELAMFIQSRIELGEKKKYIAEQLGEDAAFITRHLSILEAPAIIREAFDAGRLAGPDHVYDLSRIYAKNAEAVEEFLATAQEAEITRRQIQDLADRVNGKNVTPPQPPAVLEPIAPPAAQSPAPAGLEPSDPTDTNAEPDAGSEQATNAGREQTSGMAWPYAPQTAGDAAEGDEDETPDADGNSEAHQVPFHNPDNEKTPRDPVIVDPTVIKKPLLLATYKKRDVMVMLNKKPTTAGLAFIKFEDGSGEEEVEMGLLKNLTLTDAKA